MSEKPNPAKVRFENISFQYRPSEAAPPQPSASPSEPVHKYASWPGKALCGATGKVTSTANEDVTCEHCVSNLAVFLRKECTWQYCPHPELCQQECQFSIDDQSYAPCPYPHEPGSKCPDKIPAPTGQGSEEALRKAFDRDCSPKSVDSKFHSISGSYEGEYGFHCYKAGYDAGRAAKREPIKPHTGKCTWPIGYCICPAPPASGKEE